MVICDTNPIRSCIRPAKNNTPLLVDPDAVITFQISAQGLQSISWWSLQVIQPSCVMDHIKFSPSCSADAGPSNPFPQLSGMKEPFSVGIWEWLNSHSCPEFILQRYTVPRYIIYSNRRLLAGVYQYVYCNFRFVSAWPVVCGIRVGYIFMRRAESSKFFQ